MTYYVGIVDGSRDAWGVRVPDLPGCHGAGATPDDAVADATSAAREWAAEQRAGGEPIPKARSFDEVRADPRTRFDPARETMVLIPLLLDEGRMVRANISMDAGLLLAIDEAARRRGLTRSAFLASAAREKIEGAA